MRTRVYEHLSMQCWEATARAMAQPGATADAHVPADVHTNAKAHGPSLLVPPKCSVHNERLLENGTCLSCKEANVKTNSQGDAQATDSSAAVLADAHGNTQATESLAIGPANGPVNTQGDTQATHSLAVVPANGLANTQGKKPAAPCTLMTMARGLFQGIVISMGGQASKASPQISAKDIDDAENSGRRALNTLRKSAGLSFEKSGTLQNLARLNTRAAWCCPSPPFRGR